MKNAKLLVLCVVIASLVPGLAVCAISYKSFGAFSTGGKLAAALEHMAVKVESRETDHDAVANQLRTMAVADRKIEGGVAQVQRSYYLWAVLFLLVAIAQGLLMRKVIILCEPPAKHITKSSKVTPQSGAL